MKNHSKLNLRKIGISFFVILLTMGHCYVQAQNIVITKNDIWKYLDSGQYPGNSWSIISYNDDSWLSGVGIFGFGSGDEGTVISFGPDTRNKFITTYFRKEFNIINVAAYKSQKVRLIRDDGAIVYLNGQRLLSSNMPELYDHNTLAIEGVGDEYERTYFEFVLPADLLKEGINLMAVEVHQNNVGSSDLSFDLELELSTVAIEGVRINEVLPSNFSHYPDPELNQFQDWIELYNPQASKINIGGYYVTDDLKIPDKWQIPEGTEIEGFGFLLIYADGYNQGLHSNFALAKKGERIGIFTADLVLIDSLTYPPMLSNVSYGIMDSNGTRGFFGDPTAMAANTHGSLSGVPVIDPVFSHEAGFYSNSLSITMSTPVPGGTIRYTTDGSDPNQSSARYNVAFSVNRSMVVKARVYADGLMPSRIITKSYFIGRNHDLPVISIATNSDFLDDSQLGIYRQDRLNERRDWERPGTMEFFETDGSLGFLINIDYRLFGRGAIYFPQKSLAIFARDTDGSDGLIYNLFPGTSVSHFQSFILRSSSDDWRNTMIRDGLIHTLLKNEMDLEYMDYRPAVLYINGEYMGIHNIRDKLNEDYLATHKAVDPDNIDLLFVDNDFSPPTLEVKAGNEIAYKAMWNFISQNDMSNSDNYIVAQSLIDIENYQNYCCVQIITGNRSWLHNRRVWRPKTPGGKFRFMLFDLDYGYIFLDQNILNSLNSKDLIFKSLMKNQSFKAGLIQKLANYSHTIFKEERVVRFIDSLAAIIQSEIPRHSAKWGGTYPNVFTNLSEWQSKVQVLKTFASGRQNIQDGYIQSFLGNPGKSDIEFKVLPSKAGNIYVNKSFTTDDNLNVSFYKNYPLSISAKANDGFRFDSWEGFSSNNSIIFSRGSQWKYNDSGANPGSSWSDSGFDDSAWESGIGPLGYGRSHIETSISYGGDGSQKFPASYFRKEFTIQNKDDFLSLSVRIMRDDGAVVYLNGQEQFRVNMPTGTINYSTYATTAVWGDDETSYFDVPIDLSDLVDGTNSLAVEIHQESPASSDLIFDLELLAQVSDDLVVEEVSIVPSSTSWATAKFSPNAESDIVISEIFYRPTTAQGTDEGEFIELYNKGTGTVDLSAWTFSHGIEFTFPQNSTLNANGALLIVKNASNFSGAQVSVYQWSSGFLSNIGEAIGLVNSQGALMDKINFGIAAPWPASTAGYSIELGDVKSDNSNPASWSSSANLGGSPGYSNSIGKYSKLKINEFVALPGNTGYMSGADWIEIVNTGTEDIDIGGLFLSDDSMNPLKHQIPEDNPLLTTLAAGSYIVLIADGQSAISTLNLGFKLNANGGSVVLSESVNQSFRIIDNIQYEYLTEGESFGRFPDATGSFTNQDNPTPGSANVNIGPNIIAPAQIAPGDIFPVIVRITDQNGDINRQISTTLTLSSSHGSVQPNQIKIRHGVGTLSIKVNTTEDFDLIVGGYNYTRGIKVNADIPRVYLSGTITESRYLQSGVDYVINSTLDIASGAVLYVMPGVRLLINEKVNIRSKGLLKFQGSFNNPIMIMPKDKGEIWGGIKMQDTPDINVFNWTIITGAGGDSTKARGHSKTQPALYAQSTSMALDQCFLVDNNGKSIYAKYADILINNSVVSRCDTGPEMEESTAEVYNSWFLDLPNDRSGRTADDDNDGIYFHGHIPGDDRPNIVSNCVIYGSDDDGIDTSTTTLKISDCIFSKNYEKGISAGWRSDVSVERSLFYDNYMGVSSTFWTQVVVNQSTFSKNNIALYSSYEGGGIIKNSILSEHKIQYAKDFSEKWYFEYCLSDSDPDLMGKNNLFGNPGFINKNALNFHLSPGSMAINAGDPEANLDSDGTPADLGMFHYDGRSQNNIVISEIYYNPPPGQGDDRKFEFLEIVNPGSELIHLRGYRLIDGIEFIFPNNSSIAPGELILVVSDAFTYQGLDVQVFEWDKGKLSNSGERIALLDNRGRLVDDITYLDHAPWPASADGDGYSLELLDPLNDNSIGSSWSASSKWGGSPGEINLISDFTKISLNEIMVLDNRDVANLFKGFESWIEIYNDGVSPLDLGSCKFELEDGSSYVIPVGSVNLTSVPAKGYSVFIFNSIQVLGANHIPLIFNGSGDKLVLLRNTDQGWQEISQISINSASSSYGRYPDGGNLFYILPSPSPGYSNSLASPDLITMRTIKSGERLPVILWKHDLSIPELTKRNATIQVVDGSADFRIDNFETIEGVGNTVSKVDADDNFTIEVGEWGDTARIILDNRRHIYYLYKYIVFDQVWTPEHDYYIVDDLDVRASANITILPGTRVFLSSEASINITGSLTVLGTQNNPVLFAPQTWGQPWGQIKFNPFSGASSMEYAIFIGGGGDESISNGHTNSQAVIRSSSADVNMNNCFIIDNPGKGIYVKNGTLNFTNGLISNSDSGIDGNNAYLNVGNSHFTYLPNLDALDDIGDNDAIFAVGEAPGGRTSRIENCVIAYIRDDGIDLYDDANTIMTGINFQKIGDKVASITNAKLDISFSLIQNSDNGLVAKENGRIDADHLTFYNNGVSLRAYSNNPDEGHGRIDLENSIISGSIDGDIELAQGSEILLNYSISDRSLHSGNGNLNADPLFNNTIIGDFTLQRESPAINTGNPASPYDNDGSRTDMGAFVGSTIIKSSILINEIMYAPEANSGGAEFIELVNSGLQSVDISGYSFGAGITYVFPEGTIISAGDYLIVTKNTSSYSGNGYMVFQWQAGDLSDDGEEIQLMNNNEVLIDYVTYGSSGSWPTKPNGLGPSLELKSLDLDNSLLFSWRASFIQGGTPGEKNSSPLYDGVLINEFMARNISTIEDNTGAFVDWVELFNPTDNFIQLNGLYLTKYDNDLKYFEINGSVSEMLLAPGDFKIFWLDGNIAKGSTHANFELAGSGGFIALTELNGNATKILDSVYYSSMTADISYGRYTDATDNWILFDQPTPGSSNIIPEQISGIHINEILARNSSVFLNDIGEYDDWIELYNSTNEDIDIGGLYISDNKTVPFKSPIPRSSPAETTIPAKGFLMLFPSGKPDSGIRHLIFQLAGGGEHVSIAQLYLGEPFIIDSVSYPGLSTDQSWGHTNDGGPYWNVFLTPTPNATNGISSLDNTILDNIELNVYPNPATDKVFVNFTNNEVFDYQVDIIAPLAQTIRLLAEAKNQMAFSHVSLSFDIRELGIDAGSYVFFRIRINGQNHIRKVLIIRM